MAALEEKAGANLSQPSEYVEKPLLLTSPQGKVFACNDRFVELDCPILTSPNLPAEDYLIPNQLFEDALADCTVVRDTPSYQWVTRGTTGFAVASYSVKIDGHELMLHVYHPEEKTAQLQTQVYELYRIAQRMFRSESVPSVWRHIIDAVESILSTDLGSVWEYTPNSQALVPFTATAEAHDTFETLPTFRPGNSLAWTVFESGEPAVFHDLNNESGTYDPDSPIRSEVIVPVGDFGLFIVGSREPHDFTESERQILELLGSVAEATCVQAQKRVQVDLLTDVYLRSFRHNIRNKMTVAGMHVDRLPKEYDAVDGSDESLEYLNNVIDSMANMSEKSIELATIFESRTQSSNVNISRAIQSAINEHVPDSVSITTDISNVSVVANPHLPLAIENLVENAVQHCDIDSLELRIAAYMDDRTAVIEVEDNGPGVEEQEVDVISTNEITQLSHSVGFGLWIAAKAAEFSGGSLEVQSDSTGSRFKLRIPDVEIDWT